MIADFVSYVVSAVGTHGLAAVAGFAAYPVTGVSVRWLFRRAKRSWDGFVSAVARKIKEAAES